MSLFTPEIAIMREIELLISESSDQNFHFHVFFPKSSLCDDQNDNKLWFKTTYNKITGVVFDKCDFVKEAVWAHVLSKLSKLKHLERVIIYEAKMKRLPNLIGELRHIKRLIVNNSHLKELPDSIGDLVNLERINLSDNSLEFLPESIGDISSLEEIYLWRNNLKELPESIFKMQKLKEVYLKGNSFVDQSSISKKFKAQGIEAIF